MLISSAVRSLMFPKVCNKYKSQACASVGSPSSFLLITSKRFSLSVSSPSGVRSIYPVPFFLPFMVQTVSWTSAPTVPSVIPLTFFTFAFFLITLFHLDKASLFSTFATKRSMFSKIALNFLILVPSLIFLSKVFRSAFPYKTPPLGK